jgi:hypothetical protein
VTQTSLPLPQMRALGETTRRDTWWLGPGLVFLGFMAFIVYSTWAAFQGNHYWFAGGGANYLSPMYSPELWHPAGRPSPHAWFGEVPEWLPWPSFIAFSPAFLILWAPGGFRFTCYYYRGAYYKAFWADPPNCSVGEPSWRGRAFRGEQKFPLILQNIHRYFFYLAALFIGLLSYDAVLSYIWTTPDGVTEFGIGVGTIVLTINPILLGLYTFGCHSLRHLIGGRKDCLSECTAARQAAYGCVSALNRRHMLWAWLSLFWVGFTDVYVRLCSMGVWTDWRIV